MELQDKKEDESSTLRRQKHEFYSELEGLEGLDNRDNRGKGHDLSIILLVLTLALLSKREGNLSSIQGYMKNHYLKTCKFIGITPYKLIKLCLVLNYR